MVLQVNGLSKTFVASDGGRVPAVEDVSLDVRPGEFVSIIGPSGCGKSTLFQIIGGLLSCDAGDVRVDDNLVIGPRHDVGMVFQEESTFPWRTVIDNVCLPLEIAGMGRAERRAKARRFIKMVGLEGFEERYPDELSGGMRQRTAIARTLAFEPRILLMDEPFASLDEQTRLLLGDKILQIWRELNQTTLLITHNLTEAVQLSDRVVVMSYRPGRIKRILDINLPRPRDSTLIVNAEFGLYVGLLWQDLREEAMRGLTEADASHGNQSERSL